MKAETQTQREDGHVKMEADTRVMLPQEKCLGPQKLKEAKKNAPQRALEGVWPATTLTSELWPPEVGKNTFLLFQATQFGTRQPREKIQYSGHRRSQCGWEEREAESTGDEVGDKQGVTQDPASQGKDLGFNLVKWDYGQRSGKM